MPITSDVQRLAPGAHIALYDIDMSAIGGGILRYVPGNLGSSEVRWKGHVYMALPIDADGFERSGRGQLPTPTLTVARDVLVAAAVVTFDDLRGAKVVRWRTLVQYLDGQPAADPNQHFPPDIFRIERKVIQNRMMIRWELSADIDQQGRMIPGRVATKNHCGWIYRHWTGAGFSYSTSPHACPYTGPAMFEHNGNPTGNPALDRCGKRLSDCKLRFKGPLPGGFFPGIQPGR